MSAAVRRKKKNNISVVFHVPLKLFGKNCCGHITEWTRFLPNPKQWSFNGSEYIYDEFNAMGSNIDKTDNFLE